MKFSLLFVLLFAFKASGQDLPLSWINKNLHELNSESDSTDHDLSFLLQELRGKNVIGLGEASHGTHEFYIQKKRVIEYLIAKCDFKLITFEAPHSMMGPIDGYLQTGEGNLKALMKPLALYNTEEIYDLFQGIRQYNKDRTQGDRVVLLGLDSEDYWGDPFTRDKFMTENLVNAYENKKSKTVVWSHNVHLMKDTTSNSYAMGLYLNQHFQDDFYAIGFDTFQGTVNVLNDGEFEVHSFQAEASSFSSLLAQSRPKMFFLPFHKNSPLLGTTALITNVYSNWQGTPKPLPIKPGVDFDGIIFIRDTSASIKNL